MFIKGKVNQIDCNFLIKKTNDKMNKKQYWSHAFIFVYKTSALKACRDPINFLTHNNHQQ